MAFDDAKVAPDSSGVEARWIPVGARLPNDGQLCAIVSMESWPARTMAIARYRSDDLHEWEGQEFGYYLYVTHWLPLPEPPENR